MDTRGLVTLAILLLAGVGLVWVSALIAAEHWTAAILMYVVALGIGPAWVYYYNRKGRGT